MPQIPDIDDLDNRIKAVQRELVMVRILAMSLFCALPFSHQRAIVDNIAKLSTSSAKPLFAGVEAMNTVIEDLVETLQKLPSAD